jgi:hypothetical protein
VKREKYLSYKHDVSACPQFPLHNATSVLTWWLYNVLGVANLMLVPIGANESTFYTVSKTTRFVPDNQSSGPKQPERVADYLSLGMR